MTARVLLSPMAKSAIEHLQSRNDKRASSLLRAVTRAMRLLEEHPFIGDQVPHALIPSALVRQSNVRTLWRLELPSYWRLLYTIKDGPHGPELIVLIIAILDHSSYDKLFGYKKL